MRGKGLIPDDPEQAHALLKLFMLEKAMDEMRHFAVKNPESLIIPLKAMQKIRQTMPGSD